jgi:hypothetical protein
MSQPLPAFNTQSQSENQSTQANVSLEATIAAMNQEIQALRLSLARQTQPPSSSSSHANGIKVPKPNPFTGERRQIAESWLFEMEIYFGTVGLKRESWVAFAQVLLKEQAIIWWRSVLRGREERGEEASMEWAEFSELFLANYQPIAAAETARAALAKIRQTGNVAGYCSVFRSYRNQLDYKDMSEKMLLSLFQDGLKDEIGDHVRAGRHETVEEAMQSAQQTEHRLAGRSRSRPASFPHQPSRSFPSTFRPPSFPSSSAPMDLSHVQGMQDGYGMHMQGNDEQRYDLQQLALMNSSGDQVPMSYPSNNNQYLLAMNSNQSRPSYPRRLNPVEQQQCMRMGLCFKCKQKGHISRECPTFPQKNTQNQQ